MNEINNSQAVSAVQPTKVETNDKKTQAAALPELPPDTFEKGGISNTNPENPISGAVTTEPIGSKTPEVKEFSEASLGKKIEPPSEGTIKKMFKWVKRIFAGAQAANTVNDYADKFQKQPTDNKGLDLNSVAANPSQTLTKEQIAENKLANINVPDPATFTADTHL